uniref:Uncharacterized protein n=1 Tax=Acrobeloides nanus TaxID=290746 RepID=A0A914C4T4_9BILA
MHLYFLLYIRTICSLNCYECDSSRGISCNPGIKVNCTSNEDACSTLMDATQTVFQRGCIQYNGTEACESYDGLFACYCYKENCNHKRFLPSLTIKR